jgi:hypothetical protein
MSGQAAFSETACPADRIDGPLYADGTTYYGSPARDVVEAFLAPPHDAPERIDSGTQNVDPATLRILTDRTDAGACRRLTRFLSNGTREVPPSGVSVYFTAGGFYFVAEWRRAMALSNMTTGYDRVMVFDSNFNPVGFYAF